MLRKFFRKGSQATNGSGGDGSSIPRSNSAASAATSDDGSASTSGGSALSPTSRIISGRGGATSPTSPPMSAFQQAQYQQEKQQQQLDAMTRKVEELAPFDACIEACDTLASTSQFSGRVDPNTGLVDTSLLVSADGEILIIPQEQTTVATSSNSDDNKRNSMNKSKSFHRRRMSQLGEEYESAVFVGNDLAPGGTGDKDMNGFSTKGWSIPAASLAIQQTSDHMAALANFVEDLVLTKKSAAAQDSQMIDKLRPLIHGLDDYQLQKYHNYIQQDSLSRESNFEITRQRVGPMSCPGGTIQETVVALENYYSTIAESDSKRWRKFASAPGPLSSLRRSKQRTDQRALNRQTALQEMHRRTKAMENHLKLCKADAIRKWDNVHTAEENVTKLVEIKMMERSQLKQKQRMEKIKLDEEKRAKDAAHGNLGATNSEIWDLVNSVAASMEEGSFEPMDLPQVSTFGPRDQSQGSTTTTSSTKNEESNNDDRDNDRNVDDLQPAESSDTTESDNIPIASRYELEEECGLPELRAAALAADEAVKDAAKSLLDVLSNWDTTSRSAKLAGETCLVGACNAQAACLKSIVKSEREFLKERIKLLDELENVANKMDVRGDMNHYVTLDKRTAGGGSWFGNDDDGGVASALVVLNNHIDGDNMGLNQSSLRQSVNEGVVIERDMLEAEDLEAGVEKLFKPDVLLQHDADNGDEVTIKALEEFEVNVVQLCRIAKMKSSAGRARRSTICYCINGKKNSQTEIPSKVQFNGLCRIFLAVLSRCDALSSSGVSLGKMMMNLSSTFFMMEGNTPIFVKKKLAGHPLWEEEEFWDQVLYQIVAESLTQSGVMTNFERPTARTTAEKKRSEWTDLNKLKWYDLNEEERNQAASQVHAVVFAQIGTLSHSMIEFGCGLERSSAFVRRMAVRNQLPVSQRSMLLEHLIQHEKDVSKGAKETSNLPNILDREKDARKVAMEATKSTVLLDHEKDNEKANEGTGKPTTSSGREEEVEKAAGDRADREVDDEKVDDAEPAATLDQEKDDGKADNEPAEPIAPVSD